MSRQGKQREIIAEKVTLDCQQEKKITKENRFRTLAAQTAAAAL